MSKIGNMKALYLVVLLLGFGHQTLAQYTFSISSETTNPYTFCFGNETTFHLEHSTQHQVDSVFMMVGNSKLISNDDWTITGGNQYDSKIALEPGTHDPILHVYYNGVLRRLLLNQKITVYDNPKADFDIIKDASTCGSNVFTCLENKSVTGINGSSISSISISWGDGETSSLLGDTLCHIYTDVGSMDIVYRVIDSKGCEHIKELPNAINVKSSIVFNPKVTVGKLDSLNQKAPLEIALKDAGSLELDSLDALTVQIVQHADAHGYSKALHGPFSFKKSGNGFINPFDKLVENLEPGKYRIKMVLKSHNGCQGATSTEAIVGHFSKARAYYKCADAPVKFFDSTFYWNKLGQAYCDLTNWHNNSTCIDTNDFFKRPKSVREKLFGKMAGYKPPAVTERIAWDFENDGVIDLWDKHSPSHTYASPGNKTCAVWTLDSTGAWQKSLLKFYLNSVKPAARLDNGLTYVCLPENVKLKLQDTSRAPQTIKYIWRDDRRSELQDEYFSTNLLNNDSLFFDIETDKGCRVSFTEKNLIKVLGPKLSFMRLSNDSLCEGEHIEYLNTSTPADYTWSVSARQNDDFETKKFTTKNLKTNYFRTFTYVSLSGSVTLYNPDSQKDEVCTSQFGSYPENGTHIFRSQSAKFEAYKRLGTAKMKFKVLDSLPKTATNYYTINGGPKQLITNAIDSTRYSWYFNIDFPKYGKYDVCLYSHTNLCSDTFCTTIWTENVGIDEAHNGPIKAYPNPVMDVLTLSSKADGKYEVRSITGQLLLSGVLSDGQEQVDLTFLAKGSYLLQVQTEDRKVSMPLLKH